MITARLLSVLAIASLGGAAFAQTQPPPSTQQGATPPPAAPAPGYNTSSPSSASSPHQRSLTGTPANETQPNLHSGPMAASSPQQKQALRMAAAGPGGHSWTNMPVVARSGESLGSVTDVLPGINGKETAGYVVVSPASGGMSTPVPYRWASANVRDGKLVLNQSRFTHAPRVSHEDLQNTADHSWRIRADQYWMRSRLHIRRMPSKSTP